jgi:uncharacterized protein (DUF433 family)
MLYSGQNGMSTMAPSHILIDDDGVARIAGTRMKIVHLAEDHRFNRTTPEQMKEQWPHLSLHQIYAALAYYYEHQAEIDAEMERREALVEGLRQASAPPTPTRAELERLRRDRGGQ